MAVEFQALAHLPALLRLDRRLGLTRQLENLAKCLVGLILEIVEFLILGDLEEKQRVVDLGEWKQGGIENQRFEGVKLLIV